MKEKKAIKKKKELGQDVFYRMERMFETLRSFPWDDVKEVVNGESGHAGIVKAVRDLRLREKEHREILLLLAAANERAMSFFEVWRRLDPIWEDGSFGGIHGLEEEKK